jgi:hypothetical protein
LLVPLQNNYNKKDYMDKCDIKNNRWNERFTLLLAESTESLKEEVSDIRVVPDPHDRCFMGGMKSSSASWGGTEVLAAHFLLFRTGADRVAKKGGAMCDVVMGT